METYIAKIKTEAGNHVEFILQARNKRHAQQQIWNLGCSIVSVRSANPIVALLEG